MRQKQYPGPGSRPSARPWWEDPVRLALFRIEAKMNLLVKMERIEMAVLDDLEAKLTEVEGTQDSAILLLTELSAELKAAIASGDPARVQAIIARMDADKVKLAEAVAANPDPNP